MKKLEVFSPKSFVEELRRFGAAPDIRWCNVYKTHGGQIPTSDITTTFTAFAGEVLLSYHYHFERMPAVFVQQERSKIIAKSESLCQEFERLGCTVLEGLWSWQEKEAA